MEKCIRCGKETEDMVETERGYLCFACDCERLSCAENPENPRTEKDFWKEVI